MYRPNAQLASHTGSCKPPFLASWTMLLLSTPWRLNAPMFIKTYNGSTKVRTSLGDGMSFEVHYGVRKIRDNTARSAFSRLQPGLWLWCEISLCTKCRVYPAVLCSGKLSHTYGPLRVLLRTNRIHNIHMRKYTQSDIKCH